MEQSTSTEHCGSHRIYDSIVPTATMIDALADEKKNDSRIYILWVLDSGAFIRVLPK